jgi:protein-tyrosine phosphatase
VRVFEIVPGLYQSPTPDSPQDRTFADQDGKDAAINAVIDLEGSIDPNEPLHDLGDVYLHWPIEDEPKMVDEATVRSIAHFVNRLIERGYRILVHCRSGFNRASLITGRALIARGMEPAEAIGLLRARRGPECLSNRVFRDWLLGEKPGT